MRTLTAGLLALAAVAVANPASAENPNWQKVGETLGKAGTELPGGIYRVGLPRRQHGIEITALHSHMLNEQPRLFFMYFWANDDAKKLASGLRAALDELNVTKQ